MCNINVIVAKKERDRLRELMNIMSWYSFKTNSDGEGVLYENGDNKLNIRKSAGKLIYDFQFKWAISHQRYATSGEKNESMAHPFEGKNIVLLHNGVFRGLESGEHSDTFIFTEMLDKNLDKYKSVKKAINKTLEEVNEKATTMSYSIYFYDKRTKKIYYFRNEERNMYYIYIKNTKILVASTDKNNVKFAKKFLNVSNKIKEPKPHTLYEITADEGFKQVAKLKEFKSIREFKTNLYDFRPSYHLGRYYKKDSKENKEEQEEDNLSLIAKIIAEELELMLEKEGNIALQDIEELILIYDADYEKHKYDLLDKIREKLKNTELKSLISRLKEIETSRAYSYYDLYY